MKNQIKKAGMFLTLVAVLTMGILPVNTANAQALEEKIIATNRALYAAWNSGDAAIMEANMTADFSRKQNGEESTNNREEYIGLMKMFRTAIPDITFTYELVAVSGNKTLTKWTAKGTNSGMFGDQPATGKSSVTHGFTIMTYNDEGKAILEEAYMDQLSYLQAWGYTLTPPHASDEAMTKATADYLSAWSTNDFNLMKSVTSSDLVRNANGETTSTNNTQIGETMKFWHTAIPDFNIAQGDIIVNGNKTYVNWTSTGTNTGMFGDAAPTGKSSTTQGFTALTFNDAGKIIHEQAYYDLLSTINAWGYSVTPPQPD